MSKFCMSCGAANSDVANVCSRCGKNLDLTIPPKDISKSANSSAAHKEYILKTGTMLEGRYSIKRVIGEGGFGITYEAVNEKIDMTVAIKELYCREYVHRDVTKSDNIKFTYATAEESFDRAKKRFLQEAKILSGFGDEGAIVKVLDYFEENGTAYIVMNYLHGISLDKCLEKNGSMEWETMLKKIKPLASTLERMHNRGVIHRDISASNIMVLENGSLCLLDFGAAKDVLKQEKKTTSTVFAKQGYTPIEQYAHNGNVGPWSDVYALSAVCYECLTGVCPPDSLQRSIFDEYKTLKEQGKKTSDNLEALLKKGLAVKAEDRYANMGELLKAMNELSAKKKGKKTKTIGVVIFMTAILFGVGGLWFFRTYREEILFRFKNTESFCLVKDEDVSIKAYKDDLEKIEERIQEFVGEEPYILEEQGDTVQGVLPLKCFGEEDPRGIIRDLIVRPNKWTINGVEIERKYIADINYVDENRSELVINLTENTPKEIQDTLTSLCENSGATLSVDSGYTNHLSLRGKMNSSLSYTWDVQEQWSDVNMRELFLYNISHDELTVGFDVYTQIQSIWEERDSGIEFGQKQCNVNELSENKITLEYWGDHSDDLTEGDTTDFIISLKQKLDILDIPYAIGRESHHSQRVVLCVNQQDYNEDLFSLMLKDYGDLSIQDSWGTIITDGFSLDRLDLEKDETGTYLAFAHTNGDSVQKIKKATREMVQKNIDTYFLTVNNIRILEGKLTTKGKQLVSINDGVLRFDLINMDEQKIDTDHKVVVELLNYILSSNRHLLSRYEILTYQYSNGKALVSNEPEALRENLRLNTAKETEIIKRIKELSDEYEINSFFDYESGDEKLIIQLPSQIYAESVSETGIVLEQISRIMDTCGIDGGTPWSNITIGVVNRYDEDKYAVRIYFSHFHESDDYRHPYSISVIGYEEKETKWIREIYNKMKYDNRFKGYQIDFADYSNYYIY